MKWPLAQETGYSQTRKNCDSETGKSANKHIFRGTNLFGFVQFPKTEYGFGRQKETDAFDISDEYERKNQYPFNSEFFKLLYLKVVNI